MSEGRDGADAKRAQPARRLETDLIEAMLTDPSLVATAYLEIGPEEIQHPGLQQVLAGLYRLHEATETPDIDGLREVVDNPALISWAMDVQQSGPKASDRGRAFREVLDRFRESRRSARRQQLMDRLRTAETDDDRRRLLGEIQDLDRRPDPASGGQSP